MENEKEKAPQKRGECGKSDGWTEIIIRTKDWEEKIPVVMTEEQRDKLSEFLELILPGLLDL